MATGESATPRPVAPRRPGPTCDRRGTGLALLIAVIVMVTASLLMGLVLRGCGVAETGDADATGWSSALETGPAGTAEV